MVFINNFQLSEERRQFQDMARKFAENEVKPFNDKFEDDWATHKYVAQILKKAAELGFMGLTIDAKYGGAGADGMTTMVVLEEFAAVNGGVATVIGDTWFAQTPIIIAPKGIEKVFGIATKATFLPGVKSFGIEIMGHSPTDQ